MKKDIIAMLILFILFISWLSGCAYTECLIHVEEVDDEPDNYVNMTEEQIESFPHLKEAIISNTSVKTPKNEFDELQNFLSDADTNFIKYQNLYYDIWLIYAD